MTVSEAREFRDLRDHLAQVRAQLECRSKELAQLEYNVNIKRALLTLKDEEISKLQVRNDELYIENCKLNGDKAAALCARTLREGTIGSRYNLALNRNAFTAPPPKYYTPIPGVRNITVNFTWKPEVCRACGRNLVDGKCPLEASLGKRHYQA